MLIQKFNKEGINYSYMEFKNVPKNLINWLENIAYENKCKIEKKEWRSKYNNYVAYDYEPFCAEGFEINLTLSNKEISFLNFVRYLYELRVQKTTYLECCYLM
ncbi:hypothetical protein IKA92_03025 [bacterium]|nr:hypothetical protein [bacterium]